MNVNWFVVLFAPAVIGQTTLYFFPVDFDVVAIETNNFSVIG